jgi:hypothetical protein
MENQMKVLKEQKVVIQNETIEEDENEGLISLLDKQVTFFCAVYIYTGKLVGVNKTCIKLENPKIVYETGDFNTKQWKDAQSLPNELYLQNAMIESFGVVK